MVTTSEGEFFAAEWIETDSADNALATAAHALAAEVTHYISGLLVSYSTDMPGPSLVQVKDAAVVLFEFYFDPGSRGTFHYINFPRGNYIKGTIGQAISAELAASGTATVLGKVAIMGFSG